jgi:NarL family two-component system response regulator LiaR
MNKPNEIIPEQRIIRVMLVDDHEMVRRGLIDFLKVYKDFLLVGEAADGEEAIRVCDAVNPDVILMDLVMPKMNGVESARVILNRHPKIHIIALSSYDDEQLVPAALAAGAVSFLQKNVTMNELADAIRMAMDGISTMSNQAMQYLVAAATSKTREKPSLTSRELEVLVFIADGKSNAEIANELVISLPTVKSHVSQIIAKLGAKSRTEAVRLASKTKLIQD